MVDFDTHLTQNMVFGWILGDIMHFKWAILHLEYIYIFSLSTSDF